MRSLNRWTLRAVAVLLLFTAVPTTPVTHAARPAPAAATLAMDEAPARCCFTNPGYTGTCEVQPGKDESCGQILDYLNNLLAHGKNYCLNTDIRGGWKQVDCEKK
jgi:hypothetical protein